MDGTLQRSDVLVQGALPDFMYRENTLYTSTKPQRSLTFRRQLHSNTKKVDTFRPKSRTFHNSEIGYIKERHTWEGHVTSHKV